MSVLAYCTDAETNVTYVILEKGYNYSITIQDGPLFTSENCPLRVGRTMAIRRYLKAPMKYDSLHAMIAVPFFWNEDIQRLLLQLNQSLVKLRSGSGGVRSGD